MRRALLPLLALLAVAACKDQDPLVGTWDGADTSIGPSNLLFIVIEVKPDGTYLMGLSGGDVTGTWEKSGNVFKLSPETFAGQEFGSEGLPGTEKMSEQLTLVVSADDTLLTLEEHMVSGAGTIVFTKR